MNKTSISNAFLKYRILQVFFMDSGSLVQI